MPDVQKRTNTHIKINGSIFVHDPQLKACVSFSQELEEKKMGVIIIYSMDNQDPTYCTQIALAAHLPHARHYSLY